MYAISAKIEAVRMKVEAIGNILGGMTEEYKRALTAASEEYREGEVMSLGVRRRFRLRVVLSKLSRKIFMFV